MKYQKPKGTKDVLPKEIYKWHYVESAIRDVMSRFNFSEIRTPTFEFTELFARGVGEETDIVGKEMYTFEDKGGNSLTLKPEMTAPVMRAYLENSLSNESPIQKLYYISNMFRYERPQEGRYREHTQFGAEIIGSDDVNSDIELILLAKEVYNRCGIKNFKVKINSIGSLQDRKEYIKVLREYLKSYLKSLSPDSQRRFDKNPLRILDSKNSEDIKITDLAPKILDYLSRESKMRFDKVLEGLTKLGVKFEVDFRLVRGLDYYTDTTFEFVSEDLGAHDALGGGGRYDGLMESIGGKPTSGVGFGSGIERIIMVAERNKFEFPVNNKLKLYFIALDEESKQIGMEICCDLRTNKISCEIDLLNRSLKAQMRDANKLGAEYVFIVGTDELKNGKGILKKMDSGEQLEIGFDKIISYLLNEN